MQILVFVTRSVCGVFIHSLLIITKDGNTALHIACKNSHINVIQSLLSQGADISIKNNEGKTPLDECQDTSKEEVVSLVSEYNPKRGEVLNNNYVVLLLV